VRSHAPPSLGTAVGYCCLVGRRLAGRTGENAAGALLQDPHFKATNHRRRIISAQLLAEYAFLLAPGGRLYTATDVQEVCHARAAARMRPLVRRGGAWCRCRRLAAADACAVCFAIIFSCYMPFVSAWSVSFQCPALRAWPGKHMRQT